jgi:hypothetical protein
MQGVPSFGGILAFARTVGDAPVCSLHAPLKTGFAEPDLLVLLQLK